MNLEEAKRIHEIVEEIQDNECDIKIFEEAINDNRCDSFQITGIGERYRCSSTVYSGKRIPLLLEVLKKRNEELLKELSGFISIKECKHEWTYDISFTNCEGTYNQYHCKKCGIKNVDFIKD